MSAASPGTGFRSWNRTQIYGLSLLVGVNLFNYLDRNVVSILAQPMKLDLRLEDWQLGVISGPAFALFYSICGVPIARLAERSNRVTLLSIALATWSGFTALCGAATGFVHLALARVGVGAAEGACTPSSHALVADLFSAKQRGLAMSMLTTSIPVAQLIAPIVGGLVAMRYGWRVAFVTVGLPGILLAVLMYFTLQEPRDSKPAHLRNPPRTRFGDDVKLLMSNRAFVWLIIASAFLGQAIGATNSFTASYFVREYGLTLSHAGLITGVGSGLAGVCGTFLGGWLADRNAGEYGRSYPWICGIGAVFASVFFFITFNSSTWLLAAPFLFLANISTDMKNGPNMAAGQNFAPAHMRATSSAVLMLFVTVFGTGLGPIIIGVVSDAAARAAFPEALGLFKDICPGGSALKGASAELVSACSRASAAGLSNAMRVPCVTFVIAAAFYYLSGRAIKQKLEV